MRTALVASLIWVRFVGGSICDVVKCQNGGFCVDQEGDFSQHNFVEDETAEEAYDRGANPFHCQCTADWTGRLCQIPYNICTHDHICYNGGTCIPDSEDNLCDCTTAMKDGYKYEGKYCEFKISTVEEFSTVKYEFCPCQNGGTCDGRFDNNTKCDCPPGYSGFFCEFDQSLVPHCDLTCQNGGYCIFAEDTDHNGSNQRCHCPDGFTGLSCEVEGLVCGDAVCLNGSSCVSGEVLGDIPVHHCDCRTAKSTDGKRYAGMFCQYEETDSCDSDDNIEARLFCVNGGVCKHDGELGCNCPDEYTGLSCEFNIGNSVTTNEQDIGKPEVDDLPVEDVPECTLDCAGHGTCTYGIKDHSPLGSATYAKGLNQTHDNYQHCVCKEGYTGIYCDRQIDLCRHGDLFCLHGSKCRLDTTTGATFCDCHLAGGEDGELYYGESCEFLITTTCSFSEGIENNDPRAAFCVNDGVCDKEKVGCDCPDKWTGEHCEERTIHLEQTSVCSLDGEKSIGTPPHTCQNGGTCKQLVARGMEHPGCICQDGWEGLLCDTPTANDQSEQSQKKIALLFPITIILLSLTVIITFTFKLISSHFKSEKESAKTFHWKIGAPPDTGGYDEVNLAPRKAKSMEEQEHVAFPDPNPSRDQMAEFLSTSHPGMLAPLSGKKEEHKDGNNGQDCDPKMFFGPTLDEDGFPLHNIDII